MHFNYLVKEVLCKVLVQLKFISHCSEEGYHPVKSNHCFKLYDQIIKLRGNEIPVNHGAYFEMYNSLPSSLMTLSRSAEGLHCSESFLMRKF